MSQSFFYPHVITTTSPALNLCLEVCDCPMLMTVIGEACLKPQFSRQNKY